jgi:histidine decarboxylase
LPRGGAPILLNLFSLPVVFPEPCEAIVQTCQSGCRCGEAHAIIMPNVTDALLSRFVAEYAAWREAKQPGAD